MKCNSLSSIFGVALAILGLTVPRADQSVYLSFPQPSPPPPSPLLHETLHFIRPAAPVGGATLCA